MKGVRTILVLLLLLPSFLTTQDAVAQDLVQYTNLPTLYIDT